MHDRQNPLCRLVLTADTYEDNSYTAPGISHYQLHPLQHDLLHPRKNHPGDRKGDRQNDRTGMKSGDGCSCSLKIGQVTPKKITGYLYYFQMEHYCIDARH